MGNTYKKTIELDFKTNKTSINDIMSDLNAIIKKSKEFDGSSSLEKELKSAATEAEKLKSIFTGSWNNKLNQLDINKFNQSIKTSYGSIESFRTSLNKIGMSDSFGVLSNQLLGTNLQLKQSSALLDKMAVTMANTVRFGISSSIFNRLTGTISEAYGYVKKLDSSLNDIRIVSGASAEQMERFAKQANNAAKSLGSSTLDYTSASLIYYQQGLSEEEVAARTNVTIKMANALGTSADQVSDYMTSIWNNFEDGSHTLEYYGDVITALGAATASSAEEISTGLEKFAAVGETVGLSYEYATAALATVVAETRQSADTVGTAFKTLFARLQDLELGETLDDGTTIGSYSEALEKVGINIKDTSGELKDMDVILDELGQKWTSLGKDQQVALAEAVAGTRQYTQLVALMDNWGEFQKNLTVAYNSTGTLEEQQATYMESLRAHLEQLGAEAERTWSQIIDSDAIKSLTDGLTFVLKQFNDYLSGLGGGLSGLLALGSQLAYVFQGQIANSVVRVTDNIQKWYNNTQLAKKSLNEWITIIQEDNEKTGLSGLDSEILKEQAEVMQKALQYSKGLTNEQYNQIANNEKEIAQNKKRIQEIEQLREQAKKDGEDGYGGLESFEAAKLNLKGIKNEAAATAQEYQRIFSNADLVNSNEEEVKAVTNLKSQLQDIIDKNLLSQEQNKQLQEQINQLSENGTMTEENLKLVKEAQVAEQEIFNERVKEAQSYVNALNDEEEGEYKTLKRQNEEKAKADKEALERAEKIARTQKIVKGVTLATTMATTLASTMSVLGNSASTYEEKANAAYNGISSTITGVASMINPVAGAVVGGVLAIGKGILDATGAWDGFARMFMSDSEKAKLAMDSLNAETEALAQAYQRCQQEIDNLNNSFKEYKDSIEIFNSLRVGADEYAESLEEVNKKAHELIQTYQLIQGQNYGLNSQGFLEIYEDALNNKIKDLENRQTSIKLQQNASEITRNQLNLRSQALTLNDTVKQKKYFTTADITTDQSLEIANAFIELKKDTENYDSIIQNEAKLTEYLNDKLNDSSKFYEYDIKAIIEHKNAFIDLADSVEDTSNACKYYAQQIMQDAIKTNYEEKVNTLTGGDASRTSLILAGMSAAQDSKVEQLKEELEKVAENSKYGKTVTNFDVVKELSKYENDDRIKELAELYGTYDGDEALARITYALQNNLSATDVKKLTYEAGTNEGKLFDGTKEVYYENDDNAGAAIIEYLAQRDIYKKYGINPDTGEMTDEESDQLYGQIENTLPKLEAKVGEDWTNAILSSFANNGKMDLSSFDFSKLKDEFIKAAENNEDFELKPEDIGLDFNDPEFLELMKTYGINSWDEFKKGFMQGLKDYDIEDYKKSLETYLTGQVKTLKGQGTDEQKVETLKTYVEYLKKPGRMEKENQKEIANTAIAIYKYRENVEELAKTYSDNLDNLKAWYNAQGDLNKLNGEQVASIGALKDSLQTLFGTEISNDFILEHFEKIGSAINGDADALTKLQQDLVGSRLENLDIDISTDEAKNAITNLQQMLADTQDLELGATIEISPAIGALNNLIDKAHMTESQVNELLDGMGYEPVYEMKEQKVKMPVISSIFDEKPGIDWEEVTISLPKISSVRKKNDTTYFSNYSSKNGGTGKSGSSSMPKKNTSDDKLDRYQEVNTRLEETSAILKELQKQQDKLLGNNLVKNLDDQLAALNQEIDLTKQKISIAQGEQNEYANALKNYGIQFNKDGSINQQSYANIFNAEQNRYTNANTDDDAAKKRWEDFKNDVTAYNNLIKTIDDLKSNIQADLDKEIELNVSKLHLEVELRMDMKKAAETYNEFQRAILDNYDDDDIIGKMKQTFNDVADYFDKDIIKSLSDDITEMLDQFNNSDIYKDNANKLMEDLQKYYEELMKDLEDIKDKSKDIETGYADMLKNISEEINDQVGVYDDLSNTIQHDMKLIQMISGEDAYKELGQYYQQQADILANQIALQQNQMNLFAQQMQELEDAGKKDTEAWQTAQEEWIAATKEWQTSIEDAIDNLKDKYENAINEVFASINDKLTGGNGLDIVAEEWELINKNAEEYLDNLDAAYGIQQLQDKYLQSIDDNDNILQQNKLNNLMKDEIAALREKDKLSQYDLDRADLRYQIALKQMALEEAQQNKTTLRLRRDSQGNYTYQYTQDEDEITKLQSELSDLYNQLYNLDKGRYSDSLKEIYDVWTEYQEKMAEAAQINDPEARAEREYLIQEQYAQLLTNLTAENENLKYNLKESALAETLDLYDTDVEEYNNMTEEQKQALQDYLTEEGLLTNAAFDTLFGMYDENVAKADEMVNSIVPTWESGIQDMVDAILNEDNGMATVLDNAWDGIQEKTETYEDELDKLAETAGIDMEDIKNGIDPVDTSMKNLIEDAETLFDKFNEDIDESRGIWKALDDLIDKYETAIKDAAELADTAYKTTHKENEQDAQEYNAAEADIGKTPEPIMDLTAPAVSTPAPTSKTTPAIGSWVTLPKGTYFYKANGAAYPNPSVNGRQVRIDSTSGDLWQVYSSALNPSTVYIKKSALGFDTGGYTGEWTGNNGRLAMLHQKELVLNAKDTENILAAVSTIRTMSDAMLSRISAIAAPETMMLDGGNGFVQDVKIEATFPNVTNSNEIEEAFNNLVNLASQRIGQH